jgi:glycosyltransferase involved in cell wall biosynthesis
MVPVTVDIAIPVLNEEKDLTPNIEKVLTFLREPALGYFRVQLVIADNGSIDQTPAIGKALALGHPGHVRYVRLEQKGVGRALKRVWNESSADIVGYFDVDLATDLNHLPQALEACSRQGADLVYGTRLHRQSVVRGRTLKREITSRVFNTLVRFYLGTGFSDGMCGFKFLRRAILGSLQQAGAVSDGWFFSTELLATAEWMGYRLYELPVRWTDSSDSRVKIVRLSLQYLEAMRVLKKKKPASGWSEKKI